MPRYYQAVAMDLDGTIVTDGPPDADVLVAIKAARVAGLRVLLVTGRIRAELEAEFPGLADRFDAVVTENGAVVATRGLTQALCPPVDSRLAQQLAAQGVAVRTGEVLVACDATAAHQALDLIQQSQLDAQLVTNRGALMILPAGVTKGTGVRAALDRFGISPHSAIGIGDAENDHSLLTTCELGVAVANAVPALTEHADLILPAPNGTGVAALLHGLIRDGTVTDGTVTAPAARQRLVLGQDTDGHPVTLPASRTSILISGDTGAGKSYLTGLLAEQMITLGYSVLVIDPEGDHIELGMVRNTVVVGVTGRMPSPLELINLIRHDGSIVLDLSLLSGQDTTSYLAELSTLVDRHRERTGLPHWVVVDEAHTVLGRFSPQPAFHPTDWGFCLATYRPDELPRPMVDAVDWRVSMGGQPTGQALLRSADHAPVRFRIAARATNHTRHQHKYTHTALPVERGFHFRTEHQHTGTVAVNLRQFVDYLRHCDPEVLRHHAAGRDFSRWIRDVHRDQPLANQIRHIEGRIAHGANPAAQRRVLIKAITRRYGLT